ncbi:MAG: uroporphyrinogen-III synthase, partial [Verrucomicrobiota bacterium]|nr:uroporphyrinogen-III synthase [Verrucomicrobiota bacterium]
EVTREILARDLTALGAVVDEAIAYRTLPEIVDENPGLKRFEAEGADLITFTSSSTVENFLALKLPLDERLKTASIGPITSQTMRNSGLRVDVEATRHDISGLVEAIRGFYDGKKARASR